MNERIQNTLTLIAVFCAVAMTGLVVRREFRSDKSAAVEWRPVRNEQSIISSALHSTGPLDADVTLIEFFDFQCPACRMLVTSLDSAISQTKLRVRVVRHHFPLSSIHPTAQELALVGICLAGSPRFDEYYHSAFEKQHLLADPRRMVALAALPVGVDSSTVGACSREAATWELLRREIDLGESLEIRATPSFVLRGRLYTGTRSAAQFVELIEERR